MDDVPGNSVSERMVSLGVVSLDVRAVPEACVPGGGGVPAALRGPVQPGGGPCPCRAARDRPGQCTVEARPGPGVFPAPPCAVRAGPRRSASSRRPLDGALVPGKARRGPTARPGWGREGLGDGAAAAQGGSRAAPRRLPVPTAPTGPVRRQLRPRTPSRCLPRRLPRRGAGSLLSTGGLPGWFAAGTRRHPAPLFTSGLGSVRGTACLKVCNRKAPT